MSMQIKPQWDWMSMLLYIFMGIVGALCIRYVNEKSGGNRVSIHKQSIIAYMIWLITWIVFATWRYVAREIGGMDASSYIQYFNVCLNPGDYWFAEHVDVLYRIVNKGVRLFFDDYHALFFILYGFIILSYICFTETFRFKGMNYAPMILIVYVFIRGFNTLRTNLGVSCILFSIVFLNKNKTFLAIIFAVFSVLFQVASLIYAGYLLFYYLYKKRKIGIIKCIIWIFVASFAGRFGQYIIANYDIPFLSHGSYKWYAVYSQEGQTFFTNFWKIAFSQMLLGLSILLLWKPLCADIQKRNRKDKKKLKLLITLCAYDLILIPITYILNVWRGYEYLYIVRLFMWSEILCVIKCRSSKDVRMIMNIGFVMLFLIWMVFRQYNTWEDSGLMPYVFEPLLMLVKR